uniref:Putative ribonuclease p protein component 4-like isoform x1 n=1 Tax=Culex tarsalis TaxID=7177 RepID=A0A1Q3F4W0_CULTA
MSSTGKEETSKKPPTTKNKNKNDKQNNNNNGKQNNNNNNGNNGNAKKQARLCPGRDSYERMNFLYQASVLMADRVPALSGSYGKLMKSIGKKAVLRVEPAIKRTLCTRCGVALSSSSTASYSDFRHKKLSYVEVRCKLCEFSKRYYDNKKHRIRLDDPAAVVETMEFGC